MLEWLFKKKKLTNKQFWDKYRKYLASDKWQKKRQQVLKRDKNQCQYRGFIFKCKSTRKLQIHHKNYKTVFNEDLKSLVTLCSKHHKIEHERLDKIKQKNK